MEDYYCFRIILAPCERDGCAAGGAVGDAFVRKVMRYFASYSQPPCIIRRNPHGMCEQRNVSGRVEPERPHTQRG